MVHEYDPAVHLSFSRTCRSITLLTPQVHVKASKTDPFRKGVVLVYLGRTNSDLCPVSALAICVLEGPQKVHCLNLRMEKCCPALRGSDRPYC